MGFEKSSQNEKSKQNEQKEKEEKTTNPDPITTAHTAALINQTVNEAQPDGNDDDSDESEWFNVEHKHTEEHQHTKENSEQVTEFCNKTKELVEILRLHQGIHLF